MSVIRMEMTVYADTYGEAIEIFGAKMDALKDGSWKLLKADATPHFRNGMGEVVAWQWWMEGEWT